LVAFHVSSPDEEAPLQSFSTGTLEFAQLASDTQRCPTDE